MSVEFNSTMAKALEESARRRAGALQLSSGVINTQNVTKSTESSELSMEDIATAMKTNKLKKQEDTSFIEGHGNKFRKTKTEKSKEIDPFIKNTIHNTQDKIEDIKVNAEINLGRQSEISKSLSDYRTPFTKK